MLVDQPVSFKLADGFDDPVRETQKTFRCLLEAMARPGTIQQLSPDLISPPAPLHMATAAVALTLVDHETPIWCDPETGAPAVRTFLSFHTGASFVSEQHNASFAFITAGNTAIAFQRFQVGDDAQPERGATLVVQVREFGSGRTFTLRGPGINGQSRIAIDGLPENMGETLAANNALYPRGVDWIFTCENRFVALPRSTNVES